MIALLIGVLISGIHVHVDDALRLQLLLNCVAISVCMYCVVFRLICSPYSSCNEVTTVFQPAAAPASSPADLLYSRVQPPLPSQQSVIPVCVTHVSNARRRWRDNAPMYDSNTVIFQKYALMQNS